MRFQSLQVLRAVAALGIVLFHLQPYEVKYLPGTSLLGAFARQADVGVDLFFVLSGFIMTTLMAGKHTGLHAAREFLLKRAWRILPSYWILTLAIVGLAVVAPSALSIKPSAQEIAASLLLAPQDKLPVLPVGWTLVHEAYFYVVSAAAIAFVPERFLTCWLAIWAAVVAIVSPLLPESAGPSARLAFSPLTLEFIGGAVAATYWRALPERAAPLLASSGAALLIAGMVLVAGGHIAPLQQWPSVAIHGGGSILLIAGAARMESAGMLRIPSFMVKLGDSSYSLYLTHLFVMSAAGKMFLKLGGGSTPLHHMAFIAIMLAAAYTGSLMFHKAIEQPIHRFGRRNHRAVGFQRG